jgi:hypothetical protein
MAEEPQLPAIPSITDDWDRKKRFVEKKYSIVKCGECNEKVTRSFKPGDFVFKKLTDEECSKCNKKQPQTIIEIYSEWVDPKKEKK